MSSRQQIQNMHRHPATFDKAVECKGTSEHHDLRRHLPMLLQRLDGLSQQGCVGRGEWKSRGVAWCIVEDELGESVQQEDGGASSYQCCSAEGVARVGLQAQGMPMQERVNDRGHLHTCVHIPRMVSAV